VRVKPKADVIYEVLHSGELMMALPDTGVVSIFAPHAAAMWISLRQCEGNPEAAAHKLSDVWEEDFGAVCHALLEQVEDWRVGGFLETSDAAAWNP